MLRFRAPSFLAVAVLLLGCESTSTTQREAAVQPVAQANDSLIVGTPPGDLEEWVADIRSGLKALEPLLESNRSEAHRQLLNLYVTRQEYLEMYYGPTGRMGPSAELGEAVKANETRFHDLMRLTSAMPPSATAAVRDGITALERQMDVVLTHASQTERRVRGSSDAGRSGQ
jgi:hypothetical protein